MATRIVTTKRIVQDADTFVGRDGELIIDDVDNTIKISNGYTPGGVDLTGPYVQLPFYNGIEARNAALPNPVRGMMILCLLDRGGANWEFRVQVYRDGPYIGWTDLTWGTSG